MGTRLLLCAEAGAKHSGSTEEVTTMETKEQEKTAVRGTCDSVDIERDFEGLCFAYRSVMASETKS